MKPRFRLTFLPLLLAAATAAGGCVAVAAGAGAAAAVHMSDRGAESLVSADVVKAEDAARKAFAEFSITETKARTETGSGTDKRVLEGTAPDREITITISADGDRSKVEVVARKSAVTWDKDYAKAILQRVITLAG
jgi:hypothetical protein